MAPLSLVDLKKEIDQICENHRDLQEDGAFAAWFLRACVCDTEEDALKALTGAKGDKNVDAVVIDRKLKTVSIVQSKYRTRPEGKTEKRNDVLQFAELAAAILDETAFARLCQRLDPRVLRFLTEARKVLEDKDAMLQLFYVTTAKVSDSLASEAEEKVRDARSSWTFEAVGHARVMRFLQDYLDGVAPPVPLLQLEIEQGNGVHLKGYLYRVDSNTGIESWVVPISGQTVAKMCEQAGIRLFARNVRGFLGNTKINGELKDTLHDEPGYFWYYNNGITIICDEASMTSVQGIEYMRLRNPQVINGQQTTRTLGATKTSKAAVMLRVIRVPRGNDGGKSEFDKLVSKIVAATNFQNPISQSDLMSNDSRQIEIERAFRRCGYYYLRKRMTKSEARAHAPQASAKIIPKELLAQAVAACDMDPGLVRGGKEHLFSKKNY